MKNPKIIISVPSTVISTTALPTSNRDTHWPASAREPSPEKKRPVSLDRVWFVLPQIRPPSFEYPLLEMMPLDLQSPRLKTLNHLCLFSPFLPTLFLFSLFNEEWMNGWIPTCNNVYKMHGSGTSLVVQRLRLHASNAGGAGLIPGRGAKIPHASRPKNQNIKQKQNCNKFNEDF